MSCLCVFQMVKDNLNTQCKCHGVSGSCTIKTCWTTLPSFRVIGNSLMERYDRAKRVVSIKGKREWKPIFLTLKRSKHLNKKPRRKDLVYIHKSPNYCDYNPSMGVLGTVGRKCNRTSTGLDRCELMCCGRGYNTHQYDRTWQCNCKFHWCCRVTCQQCTARTEEYTCK